MSYMNYPRTKEEFFAWFKAEHIKLHTEWSADVGKPWYNKRCWISREAGFHTQARTLAGMLGVEPPFIRAKP